MFFRRQFRRQHLETVGFFTGKIAADPRRFVGRVSLIEIEIGVILVCHDDIGSGGGGLDRRGAAQPAHHGCAGDHAALIDFAPADHAAAVRTEKIIDLPQKIIL